MIINLFSVFLDVTSCSSFLFVPDSVKNCFTDQIHKACIQFASSISNFQYCVREYTMLQWAVP